MEEPMEEPAADIPTEYPRNETLYVSGAAWGPASTWNPFQPGSLANTTGTIGYVYEFLYAFDPQTGELTPWLAEDGAWTDDFTFEVTLREGLTWSDGEALTAEDVAFTFELGNQYEALWFSPMWRYMESATAVSDTVVQFTFTDDPLYQEFSNNLYNIPIVPEHIWADKSEEDITVGANEEPVGSGAYMYLTNAEDRNVWVRNDAWWGQDVFGTPAPKYIVDIRTSSNSVALGMVLKGELDLSNNFLPGVAELAEKGYVSTYFEGPPYMLSANTAVLFLNTTQQPMDDAGFRKALAFAIDVPSIVNIAYAQLVAASNPTGLLPSLSDFSDQAVVDELGYSFDTEQAKQLLADAGYVDLDGDGFVEAPDGSTIELQVTCPNGWTDWMAAIDIIASSAQEAGINIQSSYPDYGAWNTELQGGTFNMTLNNWAAMSNTPWTLYNLLFRHPIQDQMQSGNFGRYDSQELFDLVDALARVPADDIEGMQAITSQIQELMLTEVPMIPLWYNGMWSQWSESTWTGWPDETSATPTLPTTWSGYWQLGGLLTLINLEPVAVE
ncbi:MAG: ABC transporter substrate-binding protein [Chloroflexi bacterium]|nr:MAG: ABC transporter substrate-binding protein [Chloroflexota bacterium]MBL1194160.1 ABC transporter substrate-binding protein [Chloroflexota bacterium]